MLIVYYSLTGNVRRFIQKTKYANTLPLEQAEGINEPYIIVTGTIGFGEIPDKVKQFLDRHRTNLIAVAASGNRNWGQNFGRAGDLISTTYHVPLLMKFELHGNEKDVKEFMIKVEEISENRTRETVQSY
ncbi:class Ib ribonucleoside-diphosphate reductase assembly flavoprotein NrdI [Macrococcus armenti]|uniref:Protein NrdI n=1 Tax=Macrococcus armenti TaxID=2875764 RepID=A0ABY3ZXE2_9STAP|nr:class Ib ribonucleoside-diphosphate reductase assembly flavoprotein NrdI [Macrococcus armenti]UBH09145.1 class Ib ribonucleoside-diphosphate reductase assembly flavoprotein NrdI [Macrococcus armenti]UBH11440.1 class Ib ribonucleoside-diphosphate reductase assembly flavoprotein NrdI [Macrococcus armenti]UBH15921.1 class Ib ribonucleoside-diphosphate reductase assembly flavoprotein NrdI [Macrococcus armenti]UBH18282.1 class Ib ribonucleoside-diphosphate reductase assembly flavoprotein NrdI [Ma